MQDIEKIYDQYSKQVYKYLFCLTQDDSLSEELTQETFYIAVKKINTFRNECKISTWLCQIAKHLWYKELKKNKRVDVIPIEEQTNIKSENNTEEEVIHQQDKLQIYKEIQKLDEKTKEVIYLRLMGELSFKEIGEILNKNETWARVIFYRGKQKIKEGDFYEKDKKL